MTEDPIPDIREVRRAAALSQVSEEMTFQAVGWDNPQSVQDCVTELTVILGKAAQESPMYRGPDFDNRMFNKRLMQLAARCLLIIERA